MGAFIHRRWVLSRSLLRETLPTLILACGVTTFLLVIRQLFLIADLFISRDVRPQTALWLIGLALPNILALTLPIATLFAVMMTASRLSSDSELVALQACGLPLTRTLRPLLGLAGVVFALNAVLSWVVLPEANRKFSEMSRRIYFSAAKATIQPKVFIEDFPQKLLYLDSIDPENGRWHGVLLFDLSNPLEERLMVADSGELTSDPLTGGAKLELRDLAQHVFRTDEPDKQQRNDIREQTVWLLSGSLDSTQTHSYGVKETASAELVERSRDPKWKPSERLEAAWEAHKRLAIPAAALAFAVVGFPLGVRNRRAGRGSGLTASVGLVVAYYILLNVGETMATEGRVPVLLCAWIPNLILLGIGYLLIARAHRAARTPHWLTLIGSAAIGSAGARAVGRAGRRLVAFADRHNSRNWNANSAREFLGPGRDGRFRWPVCILDGYVLRQCVVFLGLVLVAICALWLVVNLSEELEHIRANHIPLLTVASYYLVSLPQILHDMLPLAFLIAFLGTATVLERRNETTALKASGISVTRVVMPLFALALALGVGLFVVDDHIVQRANRAQQRLHNTIRGRDPIRRSSATGYTWLFLPDGHTLVNFLEFDPDAKALIRPTVFVFDDRFNLRFRLLARKATYRDGGWKTDGAWSRSDGAAAAHSTPIDLTMLTVDPDYFGREYRQPAQMSFAELRQYITTLSAAGYRVDRLQVQLHQRIAYPLSLVILAWLSLSFAFRVGRRGTVLGVALALVLGMGYFAILAFSTRLGEASLISPLLAAWTPNVVFTLWAANRHTTLQT